MAISSNVLTDDSVPSVFDRALLRVESVLNLLGGVTIMMLVLLAVWHVVGRKLFNSPVYGYVDWIQQFMVVFAFFGLSYCQREGGHIRMDIVVMRLKGRTLWFAEWLSTLFMLILTVALVYGAWMHFDRSFDLSRPLFSRDSSMDIALPLWPAKLIVSLSFGLLSLRLLIQLVVYTRALITGEERPAGVPLPEDPMEVAAREAEAVSGRAEG